MSEFEYHCDEAFLEEVRHYWAVHRRVKDFDRVLRIAGRCKSIKRIEDENQWLRDRIDSLVAEITPLEQPKGVEC